MTQTYAKKSNTQIETQIDDLIMVQQKAKQWLFEIAAPLWADKGIHANGMFVEELNHDGSVIDKYRRLMVQARQIYCFSELGRLGWSGNWRSIIDGAIEKVLAKGIKEDGTFIHTFDSNGEVQDARPDLYNQAFGMFMMGHAGAALGRKDLFQIAAKTLKTLDEKWARPQGGYWEGDITPCPPYRQNPHMHIFEAALANWKFSENPIWRDLANRISVLFVNRFQDLRSGAVTEYFNENWQPLEGQEGQIVEPGHCFEWGWLFDIAFEDGKGIKTADELSNFARKYGICKERGIAINEVSTSGEIIDGKGRLWPQTERLKAACVRFKRTKTNEDLQEIIDAYRGLEKYFVTDIKGLWHDKMKPDGSFIEEPVKASSFYHIVCGINELLNLKHKAD